MNTSLVTFKSNFMLIVILLFFTTPINTHASKEPVPDTIDGTTKISAEDLINLINETPDLIVIDSRMDDRPQGYIEDSISLPDVDTSCDSLSKHIKTKSTPVAFYCNGVKCGRSVVAARIALKCGYTKIYWYRNGFMDWKEKGYPYITTK